MNLLIAFASLVLFEGQDVSKYTKLQAPGVEYRMNRASATTAPWLNSNSWRMKRNAQGQFYMEVPQGSVVLAMAEADAYGADVVFKIDPKDRPEYDKMAAFLKAIERPDLKQMANLVVQEDGSPVAGEALNLLARRNLLYRVGGAPAKGELLVKVTSNDVKNPFEFAQEVRDKLGDDKRLLRIFGSEVVLANLRGSGKRVRVHLVNYGRRPIEGIRVRLAGKYQIEKLQAFGEPDSKAEDYTIDGSSTEFSVSKLPMYAVVDLVAK